MSQQQATYTATKEPPTEPTHYKAIGDGVFAFYGEDVSVLIVECHAGIPAWRNLTYKQACEMAERIAKMLNGQAI